VAVLRLFGFVFAEDFFTLIDAIYQGGDGADAFRAHVREIVLRTSLGIGEPRRRRFGHARPPGYQAVPRTFETDWYPVEYPRDYAKLTVYHAKPLAASPTAAFARMLTEDLPAELQIDAPTAARALKTPAGLTGELFSLSARLAGGPRRHHDLAVLVDTRYVYLVRLESDDERLAQHRQAHAALVDSVVPLPIPPPLGEAGAVAHWSI
jgi:hypothetical protein